MKLFCKSVLCIFALFVLCIFAGCGATEYSVRDFADVTVIGYTEHGSLSIKVNDEAVNRIYADGKKDKTAALRFAGSFRFSYEGQNDEDSYFSNGDVVTINVTYDEGMARDLGVTFTDSSFEYTVEGLEDKLQTSPFEGLNVKFSGVAPYGTVQLDKSNCIQYVIDNVTFNCDNYDLSNGDKVVVKAEFNSEIAERNGYVFTENVKKYTVVGLSKYVKTMMDVDYSSVTAKMRFMVEQHVAGTETSYKSLNWFFGDADSDSDSDGYIDEVETDSETSSSDGEFDEESAPEDEVGIQNDSEDEESNVDSDADSDVSGATSSQKKKRKTDVQKLKDDFALSDFKTKFEYTPVECFYSLNPLQYSDNIFYAVYKVKGTFVCQDTSGSGYIKVGDTVVGELYVTAALTGGSADIKNNLVYEDVVLDNAHSYSIRTYPKYEDMTDDVYKSTSYVVENLEYVEDEEAYDKFISDREKKGVYSKPDVAHIDIESESDTESDTDKKKRDESESSSSSEITDSDQDYYYDDQTSEDDEQYEEESSYYGGDYDYDGGYDEGYGDFGYDE